MLFLFSDINISHGSVATLLRCDWDVLLMLCWKFSDNCIGERIMKIGQHLAKLEAQKYSGTFFSDTVYVQTGHPSPSVHHLSYGDCLGDKRENDQNCSVLCCVRQLYTMICTHMSSSYSYCCFRSSFCL